MRTITATEITQVVKQVVQEMNFHTPAPIMTRLVRVWEAETFEPARSAMEDIVRNREIASAKRVPMCQDTGMVIAFVELGQEAHIVGGLLKDAIAQGVREGYQEGYLRRSVVAEPLFDRRNTGDNTPPIVHVDLVPGERLRLVLAAKGFGAENMSLLRMLSPADGIEGVKRTVIECIETAGPNACPPVVVGVGVGGDLEMAALLAKKALLRPLGDRHPDPRYAGLEEELLEAVNVTGIGPQGRGGFNTALEVHIEYYPTHIAALPVAVNLDCHLQRHREVIL